MLSSEYFNAQEYNGFDLKNFKTASFKLREENGAS